MPRAQVRRCLVEKVDVAMGCDGACSSDGQDMTEAIKIATLVSTLNTPEYREWLSAREALRLAYEGGAAAVGLRGKAGAIAVGMLADLTLWDPREPHRRPDCHRFDLRVPPI